MDVRCSMRQNIYHMPVIYLMRHGRVHNPDGIMYGDLPDFHLSEEGQLEIRRMAQNFVQNRIRPGTIISSPLDRTVETAQIVASVTGASIKTDERLTEWGYETWKGKKVKDFDRLSGYYAEPMVMDGMESHHQSAERVLSVMREAVTLSDGSSSLLVSHREPLACAILTINRQSFSKIHEVHLPMAGIWEVRVRDQMLIEAKLKWEA